MIYFIHYVPITAVANIYYNIRMVYNVLHNKRGSLTEINNTKDKEPTTTI